MVELGCVLSRMPKPPDRQSDYRTLPTNSRTLRTPLSHPSSLPSSSDSDPESSSSSSGSESSESAVKERSRNDPVKRSTNRNIRESSHPITLCIDSSLREREDWKREMGRQPTPRPEEGAEEPQDQEMKQVPGVDEEEDPRRSKLHRKHV